LTLRALGTKLNQPFEKDKEQQEFLKTVFDLGAELQKLTLQDIVDHKLSVLAADRVLRALTACPGAAFSKTALVCYYWIARELYTANGSDWNTGGVRAAPEGNVTAFVTGECVHALLSFAEVQEKTGIFIEKVGHFLERKKELDDLRKNFDFLSVWVEAEEDRLYLSFFLTLQQFSRYLVLTIDLPHSAVGADKSFPELSDFANHYIAFSTCKKDLIDLRDVIDQFAKEFLSNHLLKGLEKSETDFDSAIKAIKAYRENEETPKDDLSRSFMKSSSAHEMAFSAVEDALKRVKAAINKDVSNKEFNNLRKGFDNAAEEVRHLLRPAANFLSTILDRELADISLGEPWDWQPAELAFAATAYGRLRLSPDDWKKDPRLGRAANQLFKAISRCGLVPNKRPYHVERHQNLHYYFWNSTALTALAQLLRNLTKPEIEPDLIEKMLEFFIETRADRGYDDWRFSKEEITDNLMQKLLQDNSELSNNIRHFFPLIIRLKKITPSSTKRDSEKKLWEAIREILADCLNRCLEDKEFYQEDRFPDSILSEQTKKLVEELKKAKELAEELKKDSGKSKQPIDFNKFRLFNRLLLEDAYPGIIPKSGASKFSPDEEVKRGWYREHLPSHRKTDLTATAHAVFALAEINEMLDTRINQIILEHFSVKHKNKELSKSPALDSLFYPDYGLRLAPEEKSSEELFEKACETLSANKIEKKDWPKEILRKHSVAITLQKMGFGKTRMVHAP